MTTTSTIDFQKVAGLMGENFLSVEQMETVGALWTPSQRAQLAHVRFPEWALNVCCKSHILIPTVEDSINDLRRKYSKLFKEPDDEYRMHLLDTLPLGNTKNSTRWTLLRKWPLQDSSSAKPLYDHEVITNATTLVQALVFWYRTRHKWLWDNRELYATCMDDATSSAHNEAYVTIGTTPPRSNDQHGTIWIYDLWKNQPRDVLLIAAWKKLGMMYNFINRHYGSSQT